LELPELEVLEAQEVTVQTVLSDQEALEQTVVLVELQHLEVLVVLGMVEDLLVETKQQELLKIHTQQEV
jgi:hypothetical protein